MTKEQTESNEQEVLSPFQRFENFARKIIAVPKKEIDEQGKSVDD